MPLDTGVLDSVSNSNFKSLADGPAFWANMLYGDAIAHQRAVNSVRESSLAASVKAFSEVGIEESAAVSKIASSDLSASITALGAAVAGIQQLLKGAQTTIPETGK